MTDPQIAASLIGAAAFVFVSIIGGLFALFRGTAAAIDRLSTRLEEVIEDGRRRDETHTQRYERLMGLMQANHEKNTDRYHELSVMIIERLPKEGVLVK